MVKGNKIEINLYVIKLCHRVDGLIHYTYMLIHTHLHKHNI